MSKLIISVDGPTKVGKTTICRILARKYNLFHLRGGTYFRSLTYGILKHNINPSDEYQITDYAKNINLSIDDKNDYKIFLFNENITDKIYSNKINTTITKITNYKTIRELRKEWLINQANKYSKIIADGRTLGTEVFPNATIKFYLKTNIKSIVERLNLTDLDKKLILKRNKEDKESIFEKMSPPYNSIIIDSSTLSVEETVKLFSKHIDKVIF